LLNGIFSFFEWIKGWVRACPDAAWSPIQVAGEPVAAAVGENAPGLVGQVFGRVNDLCLQANLLIHMLAILYFQGFPGFFGHGLTPLNT
jgi:hypothetical protein